MSDDRTIDQLRAQIVRLKAALKPFATARIAKQSRILSGWPDHHDSEGVVMTWDPDFQDGATLTIGQFKRAKAAWEEQ